MATANLANAMFINNIGPWGLLLIGIVILVMFGRGKVAGLMGEVGKGITAFKRGVKDGSEELENQSNDTVTSATARDVTPETPRDNTSDRA